MRQTFKWTGVGLVVFGIAVFPLAIWFVGPWGVLSLVMIMIGSFLLVLSLRGTGLVVPDEPAGAGADKGDDGRPDATEQGGGGGDKPSA